MKRLIFILLLALLYRLNFWISKLKNLSIIQGQPDLLEQMKKKMNMKGHQDHQNLVSIIKADPDPEVDEKKRKHERPPIPQRSDESDDEHERPPSSMKRKMSTKDHLDLQDLMKKSMSMKDHQNLMKKMMNMEGHLEHQDLIKKMSMNDHPDLQNLMIKKMTNIKRRIKTNKYNLKRKYCELVIKNNIY